MPQVDTYKVYIRMLLYAFITMLITFLSLVDSITDIDTMTKLAWFKLIAKSSVPALISVKAYLDTSSGTNDTKQGDTNVN